MMGFYDALTEVNPNSCNIAVTVLEGEEIGEKALLSNRKIVWKSEKSDYFLRSQAELEKLCDTGIYRIGDKQIFCELLGQEKKIVICGGGHISIPLIQMGLMIGCHVTVLEDRPKFADHARRAGASEVFCESFVQGLQKIEGDEDTFFVIVTRGHRYDQVCLESIVRKPHAYIGMIGSKKRVATVKEAVIEGGGDPDVVNGIYSPIGLDIGAETPEEIAVAIMAEIIGVKNKSRHTGYSRELRKAILAEAENGRRVLATIIKRKGSAPRQVGTKMLIFPDGNCVGTIGGGCVEADILREALLMMRGDEKKAKLYHVDMTGRDAEDEGMVCGGIIEVLLEIA